VGERWASSCSAMTWLVCHVTSSPNANIWSRATQGRNAQHAVERPNEYSIDPTQSWRAKREVETTYSRSTTQCGIERTNASSNGPTGARKTQRQCRRLNVDPLPSNARTWVWMRPPVPPPPPSRARASRRWIFMASRCRFHLFHPSHMQEGAGRFILHRP
jgi:hypothetical protein